MKPAAAPGVPFQSAPASPQGARLGGVRATNLTTLQVGRLFDVAGAAARGFSRGFAALRIFQGGAVLLVRRRGLQVAQRRTGKLPVVVVAAPRGVHGATARCLLRCLRLARSLCVCAVLFGLGCHALSLAGAMPGYARGSAGSPAHGLLAKAAMLLLCPSCPLGQRARAELCATSPGYFLTLLLLPYVGLLLTPPIIELAGLIVRRLRAAGAGGEEGPDGS
jgi:hypothetical protein